MITLFGTLTANGKTINDLKNFFNPTTIMTEPETSTEPETTIEPETTTTQPTSTKTYIDPDDDDVVIWYYHAKIEDNRAVLIDNEYKRQLKLSKENFNPNKPEGGTVVKRSSINEYVLFLQEFNEDISLELLEPSPTTGTYIPTRKNGPSKMLFYNPSDYLRKSDGSISWNMVTGFDRDEITGNFIPAVYKITIPQGDNRPDEIRYIKLIPY